MSFKIAEGYVEIKGEPDRRSVQRTAELITAGVATEMNTGTAFANQREAGRKFGSNLGIHGGPNAATEVSAGAATWIARGEASVNARHAGEAFGTIIGRSGAPSVTTEMGNGVNEWSKGSEANRVAETVGKVLGMHVKDTMVTEITGGRGGGGGDSHTSSSSASHETDRPNRLPGIPGGNDDDVHETERRGGLLGRIFGGAFSEGSQTGRTGFFSMLSSIASNPIVSTIGIVVGAVLVAALGAAVSAGLAAAIIGGVGLGLLGIGIAVQAHNPVIKKAFGDLKTHASESLKGATEPLTGPLLSSIKDIDAAITRMSPTFKEMFKVIAPALEPLTKGALGFIENMMPGLLKLIKASEPFLEKLAESLPGLGKDMGTFFEKISSAGPGATQFIGDFIDFLGWLIVMIGDVIKVGSMLYENIHFLAGLVSDWLEDNKAKFRALEDFFKDLWGRIYIFFGEIWTKITGDTGAKLQEIQDFFSRMGAFVKGVWKAFKDDANRAVEFLKGVAHAISGNLDGVLAAVKKPFSDAGNWLKGIGKTIIGGLIQGIKNAIPALTDLLGWVTSKIPDWKGPIAVDRELLVPTGKAILGSLGKGLKAGVPDIQGQLQALTASMPQMAMAGAAGGGGMSFGDIHVSVNGAVGDGKKIGQDVAEAIFEAIEKYKKGRR